MKTIAFSLLLLTLIAGLSNAQNVEIPDSAFLHAPIEQRVDINSNTQENSTDKISLIQDIILPDFTELKLYQKFDVRYSYNPLDSTYEVSVSSMTTYTYDCKLNIISELMERPNPG